MKCFWNRIPMMLIIFVALLTSNCDWREMTFKRLDQDFDSSLRAGTLDKTKSYYFFSDLHRGDGGSADYFNPNRKIFSSVLKALYEENEEDKHAVVVMVGDIEELWAYGYSRKHGGIYTEKANYLLNPTLNPMLSSRPDDDENIFDWEIKLSQDGRYFRIYGNHDDYWAVNDNVQQSLLGQNNIEVTPAIGFQFGDEESQKIMVTHGCQGQPLHDVNDYIAPIAKEIELRWYYLKRIILKRGKRLRSKELEKTRDSFDKQEKYLMEWADKNQIILIVGHTHEPYISKETVEFILEREIKYIRDIELEKIEKNIGELEEKFRGLDARIDAEAYEIAEADIEYEKVDLENKKTELDFLEKELALRKRRSESVDVEEGYRSNYFNTGCCFASNIITAIKLDYRGIDWCAQLVSWDIMEGAEIRDEDSLEEVKEKIIKKPVGDLVILKTARQKG